MELERFLSALNAAWRNIYQVSTWGCLTPSSSEGEQMDEFVPVGGAQLSHKGQERRGAPLGPYNHRMWDLKSGKTSHERPVLARGVGGMWVSPTVTISMAQRLYRMDLRWFYSEREK